MDDEEEDIYCEVCYGCIILATLCIHALTQEGSSPAIFQQYVRCRRLVFDNANKDYMPVGECVPLDTLVGVDPSMLNEKVLVKYYTDLAKLDKSKMCVGDCIYWIEFKRWGV